MICYTSHDRRRRRGGGGGGAGRRQVPPLVVSLIIFYSNPPVLKNLPVVPSVIPTATRLRRHDVTKYGPSLIITDRGLLEHG